MKKASLIFLVSFISFISLQSFIYNSDDDKTVHEEKIVFSDIAKATSSIRYYCSQCSSIVTHHNVKVDGVKYRYVESKNCNNKSSKSNVLYWIENDLVSLSKGWHYSCN